jgi:Fe-Mn family superoxide dismutase
MACKPWTLNGLSDDLIVSHYENNYGGAVRALNAVRERLVGLDLESAPDYEIRSLKREELAAMGSVALHEVYFDSLGGDGAVLFTGVGSGTKMPQPIAGALEQQFGSLAAWKREFVALARALAGGSGWAVLSYSRHDGQLHNQLALDDSQALADGVPLLALDMYEHAYQTRVRCSCRRLHRCVSAQCGLGVCRTADGAGERAAVTHHQHRRSDGAVDDRRGAAAGQSSR